MVWEEQPRSIPPEGDMRAGAGGGVVSSGGGLVGVFVGIITGTWVGVGTVVCVAGIEAGTIVAVDSGPGPRSGQVPSTLVINVRVTEAGSQIEPTRAVTRQ